MKRNLHKTDIFSGEIQITANINPITPHVPLVQMVL